jgi:hypothetical protein
MRHLWFVLGLCLVLVAVPVRSAERTSAAEVLDTWYRLTLELVRHTPTYSPPVASRTFGYLGVTTWEAVALFEPGAHSLGGQLNGLAAPNLPLPAGADQAVVLNAALSAVVNEMFANTGPTGRRALDSIGRRLQAGVASGLDRALVAESEALGRALAKHLLGWASSDGGAVITNLGFPANWPRPETPAQWVPTSTVALQQAPLLPDWGGLRPFAMAEGAVCPITPPPAYGDGTASPLGLQAAEVQAIRATLTDEERAIARFWSDDPMLSVTPPGHWVSITLQIIRRDALDLRTSADALARVGIAVADAFIGCWREKYRYDLLRPVTWIRRNLDKSWEPLLTTPPFPEYPSGHSVQSAAAATVLTAVFGEDFAFTDETQVADGLPARAFSSFWQAADEAAISRLYGGIHYRAAIEEGLLQGRCIGAYAVALRTGA